MRKMFYLNDFKKRFYLLLFLANCVVGDDRPSRLLQNSNVTPVGPIFTASPPAKLSFSNSTGGKLPCSASGTDPQPKISWISQDGRPVHMIPGVMEIFPNGSLVFPPFSGHQYDTTIHDAVFRCRVTTSSGVLLSRPVQVRGVVVGDYEVQVYDQLVMVGNTGVLRCSVPSYVTEYVTVTSWVHDSAFNIYPSLHGDGKYHMTPSGELLVLNVGPQDGHSRFQCRTLHTLTGASQLSRTPARIIVTEPQGSVPPRISERSPRVTIGVGSDIMLPCVAQGHPPPQYSWFHGSSPVHQSDRAWSVGGSLVLVGASLEDSGEYHCVANNSAGTSRYTTHLAVTTPLTVQVSPNEAEVDTGKSLELTCHVSGHPIDTVSWFKDGTILRPTGRIRIRPREKLQISPVEKDDAGIYQCEATSANSFSQGHAVVALGASIPTMSYRFISQALQPGPSVSLKCIASGTPTPHISWTLDGFQLPQSHRFMIGQYVSGHGDVISHVNISSSRVSDGGSYQCEASNGAGSVAHRARLNIYGAPQVRPMGRISAISGEDFYVTCPAGGYPLDKILWKKEGIRLPANHRQRIHANGTLVIRKVSRGADDGTYSCSAFDRQGRSHSQTLSLNIIVPPDIIPFHFDSELVFGERFGVACIISKGDPPLTIEWLKDGRPLNHENLPGISVNSANEFTSMLVISNLTDKHSGEFTCKAFNDWSERNFSATLKVNVPPRLAPISFTEGTRAGMRAQVTCLAQEGDQPISLTWEKDGLPVDPHLDLSISNLDPFTSILVVKSASDDHTGNYSCVATNPVGKTTETAALVVRVPPRWTTEPSGASVSLGGTVSLQCLAKGFPEPKISWRKETVSGDFVPMDTDLSMGVRAWENGTLSFSRAERRHEGRFLCEANNGVGGGLSKVISLQVNEPPWFALRSQRQQVEVDSLAKLTCQAKGDPPLNIIWTRDGAPLPPYPRYEVSEREADGGTSSELLIRRAQVPDSGTFVCEASNPHGTLASDFHLVVQDVPNSPTGLTVVEEGSRHLTLKWTPSSDSNAPITAYIVAYGSQKAERKEVPREITVEGNQVQVRIDDLQPATVYTFSVASENRVGRSPSSGSVRHSTFEETPKGYPRNVRVNAISSAALQVTWEPPHENETHGLILGYYLGYKDESVHTAVEDIDAGAYNFTTVGVEGLGVTSATLTSLRPYTKYSVVLQAFNSRGAGPSSPPTFATTLEDKPTGAPNHITCHALTSSTLKVTWTAPPSREANGVIVSYKLMYRLDSNKEEGDSSGLLVSEGLEAILSDLQPWNNYSISIAASTRAGEGVSSPEVICKTLEDVPGAPGIVKAVSSGPMSATVSWSVPERPNGHLVGYTVYWSPKKLRTRDLSRYVEAPQNHLTLHDLTAVTYEIWVAASTSVGKGVQSQKTDVKVSPSRNVMAGVWSVGGNITVGWKEDVRLPCRTVGTPEPEITWSHLDKTLSGNTDRLGILPDGTLRIADTQKSDSGPYTCRAFNLHGSDSVTYYLRILVPPSRPFLHVTETTSSSIRLQWSIEDDGGAPMRRSNLFYRKSEGETKEVLIHGGHFSNTVIDLECGTKYHFFLTSTNRIGTSDASKEVEARTKGRPPEAPPLFQFVTTNSSQATLYLTQWESGGCDITHFLIQYKTIGSTNAWTTVGSEILPTRTFAVAGLSAGRKYELRVRAFNAAGYTEEDYAVTTPPEGIGYGSSHITEGSWDMASSSKGGMFTPTAWRDPRIVVPIVISISAFVLIIVTVCICIRNRKPLLGSLTSKKKKDSLDLSPCRMSKEDLVDGCRTYSPIRREISSTPQAPPPSEARDSGGDYSEDDIYQYASATYQIRNSGSPPPPAPPSPSLHNHGNHGGHDEGLPRGIRRTQQKGFTALVYQPPSLLDVDAPNLGGRYSVPPEDYAQRDVSETDDYGTVTEGDHNHKQRQQRTPRHRNHKSKLVIMGDCNKSLGRSQPQHSHITFRPKSRLPMILAQQTEVPPRTEVEMPERPQSKAECDSHW